MEAVLVTEVPYHGCFPVAAVSFVTELARSGDRNVGMLLSFDGAARGNPGPSSPGVCIWYGIYINGEFLSRGLLMQRGTRLGTGTNNSAEAHGLATAMKVCLRLHYWLVDQLSQLPRHIVR